MLGPKNPLLLTIVVGLANGTVSAMKCAVVMAPYRRCAKTPTIRVAISCWINPPGRSLAAVIHGFETFDPQLRFAGLVLNQALARLGTAVKRG